ARLGQAGMGRRSGLFGGRRSGVEEAEINAAERQATRGSGGRANCGGRDGLPTGGRILPRLTGFPVGPRSNSRWPWRPSPAELENLTRRCNTSILHLCSLGIGVTVARLTLDQLV